MTEDQSLSIFGLPIANISGETLLGVIHTAVREKRKITITYANQNSLNRAYRDTQISGCFRSFTIIHPDGIGIHLASRLLYGNKGLAKRLTGSDLYGLILADSRMTGMTIFFFGDTEETVSLLKKNIEKTVCAGAVSGYGFNTDEVLRQIALAKPDIVMVGLGSPLQEEWISQNSERIQAPVIIAVGEGIRIAAGNKKRGPVWLQKIGFEWLVRLVFEPRRLWKRYCIGIPVFMYRVFKEKLNLR